MSQICTECNARLDYSMVGRAPTGRSSTFTLRGLYAVRMKSCLIPLVLSIIFLTLSNAAMGLEVSSRLQLPAPDQKGDVSVEEALQQRRSVRTYESAPLDLTDVSQILWASQGITTPSGRRTAPSAGALYPLEIYLVAGEVADLPAGVYHYQPKGHKLALVKAGDSRASLSSAALGQSFVKAAPAVLVITGVNQRTEKKYGSRASRYIHMEVGHAAQNVYLQATAIGLATSMVGAFRDTHVQEVLGLPADHMPLGLMPLGKAAGSTTGK